MDNLLGVDMLGGGLGLAATVALATQRGFDHKSVTHEGTF